MRHIITFGIALIVTAIFCASLAADDKPLKVCLLSGCPTYHSEKSLPPFQEWLEKNYAVKCTRIIRDGHSLPGIEKLADYDVTFVFFKRMNLEGPALETFQKHVRSGRPIVAVRTASHADDITVLLTGSNPGTTEPLAWTREVNQGRVFYTSLGNVETFEDEQFRRMLAQAIFWTARR